MWTTEITCIVFKIIHAILSLKVPEARRVRLGDARAQFHCRSVKFILRIGGRRRRSPWNRQLLSEESQVSLSFKRAFLHSFRVRLISNWVQALAVLMHLGLKNRPFVPHNVIRVQGSPVPLLKFQMVPRLKTLNVPNIHVWLQPQLHTHRECGLRFHPLLHASYTRDSSIKWRCLLRVLCLVRRSVMTVDCVLLKDSGLVLAVGLGPKISSFTPKTLPPCQMLVIHPVFYFSSYILPRGPQRRLRSNSLLNRTCRTWMKIFHGLLGRGSWHPCPHRWDGLICVAYLIFLCLKGICDSCWPFCFQPLIGHLPSAVHFPPL